MESWGLPQSPGMGTLGGFSEPQADLLGWLPTGLPPPFTGGREPILRVGLSLSLALLPSCVTFSQSQKPL